MEISGTVDLPALGKWIGIPVQTMQKLTARGIAKPTALRMIVGLKAHGYLGSLEWLMKGLGWEPRPIVEGGTEAGGEARGAMLTGHIPPEGTTLQPPAETVKDGQPTVAERGASVSGSVLAHWNRIVGAVPFWDLIGLVAAEIDYLERRLKETGNPRILAALSEARLLKEQLQRMGEPHQILRPHDKPSP